jgi:hypothetical protein
MSGIPLWQITAILMRHTTPKIGVYISVSKRLPIFNANIRNGPMSGGRLNPMIAFSATFAGIRQWALNRDAAQESNISAANLSDGQLQGVY